MVNNPVNLKGIIHGKTIELEKDSGLPDGFEVSVSLRPAKQIPQGLLDAFGGWADDQEGLDEFLDQVYRDRENDLRKDPSP